LQEILVATLQFFSQKTFLNIEFYKITFSIAVFVFFVFLRKIFAAIILKTLKKLAQKTKTQIDDNIIAIISEPLKFAFIIFGFYLSIWILNVESQAVDKTVRSMIIFSIFWLFFEAIKVLQNGIYEFAKKFGKELYREIGSFFIKSLKIFVVAVGSVAILQEWNINVSAFIASLGLGGLAFALAAKDTAANLFGGLTILADRSLKIDDWIKIGEIEGIVEDIGLRTIKVRTFEKSLITLPNQIVANTPIENFSRRNVRRIKYYVTLTYSTTKIQMEKIVRDIKNMLKNHPNISQKNTILVNFENFSSSSLDIFIYCFANTAKWEEYLKIREDVNLKIMEIVYENGSSFAYPSQSLYIEKFSKGTSK
jgi:MscS family membrane protein